MDLKMFRATGRQTSETAAPPGGAELGTKPGVLAWQRLARAGMVPLLSSAPYLVRMGPIRRALARYYERRMVAGYRQSLAAGYRPPGTETDRLAMGRALISTFERSLAEERLRDTTLRTALGVLLGDLLIEHGDWHAKVRFREQFGCNPPDFLAVSPTKSCNLRCIGCYADSGPTREKLPWATFDRIVSEAHDLWGAHFFVITGGEPMTYRDGGRDMLDMAAQHPDCFFLMYTNGTLIDDAVARRMAELGNLTPAISAEGLGDRTDARRGAGVFDRVVAAMERLRREKVLFGVSLTATRQNADALLSDEVLDFFFDRMGCFYAWMFHYMPIGRAFTLDLMVTPRQRMQLRERMWQVIRERRLFIADFWNSGTVSEGCVAAGREGGYLHIDWNGAVSPCVFVPYSPVNIQDVYARGKTLNDVWREPFFGDLRAWQARRGFGRVLADGGQRGNWIMSCPIRDHHADFRRILLAHEPEPSDENAAAAILDSGYGAGMAAFDQELARLSDGVWETDYMQSASGGASA